MARKKYPGELNKKIIMPPIEHDVHQLHTGEITKLFNEKVRKIAEEVAKIKLHKMELLADYYEIPRGPEMYQRLALALAEEHVRGLQIKRKRDTGVGKWNDSTLAPLYIKVRSLQDMGKPLLLVFDDLSKEKLWKTFLGRGGYACKDPAEALKQQYYGIKGSRKKIFEVIYSQYKRECEEGYTSKWEQQFRDDLERRW